MATIVVKVPKSRGVKFPFRARYPAERAEVAARINQALLDHDNLIYGITREIAGRDFCEDDIQEIVQRVRIRTWEQSLPAYNAWTRTKLSSYLFRCIRHDVLDVILSLSRQRSSKRAVRTMSPKAIDASFSPNPDYKDSNVLNYRICQLANDIRQHPEKYVSISQAYVLKKVDDASGTGKLMQEIAADLGYVRASSLSMMLKRIKDKLIALDVEVITEKAGDET